MLFYLTPDPIRTPAFLPSIFHSFSVEASIGQSQGFSQLNMSPWNGSHIVFCQYISLTTPGGCQGGEQRAFNLAVAGTAPRFLRRHWKEYADQHHTGGQLIAGPVFAVCTDTVHRALEPGRSRALSYFAQPLPERPRNFILER